MENNSNEPASVSRKKKLKELLDEGGRMYKNYETAESVEMLKGVFHMIENANRINSSVEIKEHVENTSEVVYDVKVVRMNTDLVNLITKHMGRSDFSDDEYFNVLSNLIGPQQDWTKLEDVATSIARTTKWSQSMYGSFQRDAVSAETTSTQRRTQSKRSQQTAQVAPKSVAKLAKEEKRVDNLNVILKEICDYFAQHDDSIPYYKLIIDPDNFMNTVDNAFQISFLLRDGNICIGADETDGYPTVRPATNIEKLRSKANNQTVQFISTLNPTIQDEMIRKYNIQYAMLRINRNQDNLME